MTATEEHTSVAESKASAAFFEPQRSEPAAPPVEGVHGRAEPPTDQLQADSKNAPQPQQEERRWIGQACPHCEAGATALYTSPVRYLSPARRIPQGFAAQLPFADASPHPIPPMVALPLSPRWGTVVDDPRDGVLPSVEQVIAATKSAVPPISSLCARLSSPLHLPPPAGASQQHDVLRVTLRSARDLLDNRGRIQGDFYVKLRLGTLNHYESDTVFETFAPAWNEGFCFDMQTEDGDGMLELVVLDRHNNPDDYVVGVAFLDLYALHPALIERGMVEVVLGLTNQGVHVGNVDVVVAAVHRSQLERPSTQQALRMPSPQLMFDAIPDYSEPSEGSVREAHAPVRAMVTAPVVVAHGPGNIIRLTLRGFEFSQTDDPKLVTPSIRLSLGARHHRFELVGRPPYGSFIVDLQDRLWDDAVQVTAMEKHAVSGQGRLPLAILRELPFNETLDCRVPLIWMSAPAGTLLLQAERCASAGSHRGGSVMALAHHGESRALPLPVPHSTSVSWCGTIRVMVQEADIATRKAVRHLDPYVRLKFGKTACETTVRYGSNNPVGFREAFDLYHPEGAGSVLEVHLMDKKQIGTDEPLGRGFVDLVDFLEDPSARATDCEVQLSRQGMRQGLVRLSLTKVNERARDVNGMQMVTMGRDCVQVTVHEAHRLQWSSSGAAHCHIRLQVGSVQHHTSSKPFDSVLGWREGFLFENIRRSEALVLNVIAGDDRRSDVIGTGSLDIAAVLETHGGECVKVPLSAQRRPAGVVLVTVSQPGERSRLPKKPPTSSAVLPPRVSPGRPPLLAPSPRRRLSSEPSASQTRSSSLSSLHRAAAPWDTYSSDPEPVAHSPPVPMHHHSHPALPPRQEPLYTSPSRRFTPERVAPPNRTGARRNSNSQPQVQSDPQSQTYESTTVDSQATESTVATKELPPLYGPFIPAGQALASPRRIAGGSTRHGALPHSHHIYAQ
eukprot:GGOE01021237.1.p1 GENE.GGOE01021237.1~~GGOE01021237.1.p1  ORF type:complete len:964 (+),score=214.82 GGOE01021237.1:27-2894(+)